MGTALNQGNVILEAAKARFNQQMSGELLFVETKHWGNIYFRPCLTMAQQGHLRSLAVQNKVGEVVVARLKYTALNEDGDQLFQTTQTDSFLNSVIPDEIADVLALIDDKLAEIELSVEELGN